MYVLGGDKPIRDGKVGRKGEQRMNRRQARKRVRLVSEEESGIFFSASDSIPHGYWKQKKELNKRFRVRVFPYTRWRKRLKWLNKQATAEIKKWFS